MGKWLNGAQARKREIDGKDTRITALAAAGAAQIGKAEPVSEAGLFAAALEPWQAGTSYAKGAAFVHNGAVYFARQAVTAMEHQPPGSAGMEAIYGVRPIPDDDGVYPYVYNMKVEVGMKVQSAKNGNVYIAIQPADPLLYDPVDAVSIFTLA